MLLLYIQALTAETTFIENWILGAITSNVPAIQGKQRKTLSEL
jgi:hypothetical protein